MTITKHLNELRQRLLRTLLVIGVLFILFFYYSNSLFNWIAQPLLSLLPANSHMIATQVTSPLFIPLQLAFNLALLAASPYFLYQLWAYIAPALYHNERKLFYSLLALSAILFLLGVGFCYTLVLPILFRFLTQTTPSAITLMPDMAHYLNFISHFCLLFGLSFQLPLLNTLLVKINVISITQLKKFRPYAIVFAFTLGMLLTPPDVISQLLLAVPLCLLYELSIILNR